MRRSSKIARWPCSVVVAALAIAACSCATTQPRVTGPPHEIGAASYYAHEFDGRRTASGERFDMQELTAAHRTLPFGTRVRVTNLNNGRSVVVRINDRGPFKKGRILDVSYAAAQQLRMIGPGTARVQLDLLLAASE